MFRVRKGLIILFLLLSQIKFIGQTNSKLILVKNADKLSFDRDKGNAKVLQGNVICEHDGALLYCDTAYVYDGETQMKARGHILITKGDSIRVTGDKLFYDGKTKMAKLEGNVKCTDREMVLTTNVLTFDVGKSIANYYNGGTLVNKQNTLVSKNGHYYSNTREAFFHYDVVLTNPEYKMNSDTLRYKVSTKTSYFLGPSIILSKNDFIYCENGWYDTNKEKAQFSKNAVLTTSQQKLRGDSLVYDRTLKIGRAFRNVTLTDTSQKSFVTGDYVEYKELKSEALVTKKATYARILEDDTMFIAADTLFHVDIDSVNNFLNAFHHVKIYKKDMQAMSDSATYNTKDSLLQLYNAPVLWGKLSQATAKSIKAEIGKKSVKSFVLEEKAFFIQQTDSLSKNKFNQLSGKLIKGFIQNDTIRKATITGNAEMLYYAKDKNKYLGLNKTTASEINMWFKLGEPDRIKLTTKTDGKIDPMKEVDIENAKLKGFNWLYHKRPKSKFDILSK